MKLHYKIPIFRCNKKFTQFDNRFFFGYVVAKISARRTEVKKLKILYRQKGFVIMNINEMIKAMVQAQVEQAIKEALGDILGTPEVAPAEVVAEKPVKKTMSKEEFFALAEDKKPVKDYSTLDFEPVNARTLKYNGYVPSDIWTVNHLAITRNYGGKWNARLKGYTFESHADAVNFAQSYKIKTVLDDTDRHNIKVYKAERAKAKAEYYANLANK